jgi:LTXXQ motif family protein
MFWRVIVSLVLVTSMAFAQRSGKAGSGGEIAGTPVIVTPMRIDVIAQSLELSKEQKKDVKSVLEQADKEAAPIREQMIKSHQAIGEAVAAGKREDEIKDLLKSEAVLESLMVQIELKAMSGIYAKLNPTQQGNSRFLFQMIKGLFREKGWNTVQ